MSPLFLHDEKATDPPLCSSCVQVTVAAVSEFMGTKVVSCMEEEGIREGSGCSKLRMYMYEIVNEFFKPKDLKLEIGTKVRSSRKEAGHSAAWEIFVKKCHILK